MRDCINKTDKLIARALELGHTTIGITDHECVSNSVLVEKIWKQIKEEHPDFKIIRGNEIYLVRNGLNAQNFVSGQDRYFHFILLARDALGHKQLREISTRAWLRSYMARGMRRVPTYYQDLIDVIGEDRGHLVAATACFRKGTMVETKMGWKPIEEIKSGDLVLNRYGEWEEVIEPTRNFYSGPIYEIDFTGNERPIFCTEEHQFLAFTNNRKTPEWIQAKNLIGHRGGTKHICLRPFNKNYPFFNDKIIKKKDFLYSFSTPSIYSAKRYILPDEIEITPELMRLFGLFLGDGCITLKKNKNINFTLNEKEFESYYESFIKIAGEQLNIQWSIQKRPNNHKVNISSSSVELIDLFYWLFGGDIKAKTKFIPDRLKINDELSYELIFGYLLADGYFRLRKEGITAKYTTGEFTSASISERLSKDFYNLLNQLGITVNIFCEKGKIDKNGVNHQDSWYITGSNKFIGSFQKEKQYTHAEICEIFNKAIEYKKSDFIKIDNVFYRKMRIKNITQSYSEEEVYCLNNTTHSFKCEEVIVHNCLGGVLPTQLLRYRDSGDESLLQKIYIWINQIDEIFGHGNFYFEMQPSNNKDQIYVNKKLLELSRELSIPYIITTDSHYLRREDRSIHKSYLNSQNGDREVDDFYATTYMMGTDEIESFFPYLSAEELEEAYKNIQVIADSCENYSIQKPLKIPELMWRPVESFEDEYAEWFEKMPMLEQFSTSEDYADRYLVNAVIYGIKQHPDLQNEQAYKDLNENLETTWTSSRVNKASWASYFLNLQNIIDECWKSGTIVGPSRGSGGGFLLLYCLDIIQMNRLREPTQMFPWRFLNPVRVSPLDIDIDIMGTNRSTTLKHLRDVYGDDHVTNVATFRTEKSKSSILTAARGLGIDVDIAQYIANMIPSDRGIQRSLDQCMYGDEGNGWEPIKSFVFEMTENYPELWEVAHNIEGLVSGLNVHAGGVIFVDEPFTNSTALMRAPDGTICTAFELHDSEAVSQRKVKAHKYLTAYQQRYIGSPVA